jgi:hypothetical protein
MGAFVPGFETDVFISYAHEDDKGWVQAFEEELTSQVSRRLGVAISVWRDAEVVRAGDEWPDSIQQGIQRSAAFVAIVSPRYQNSEWCMRERNEFRRGVQTQTSGTKGRFFKAVKTPWADDAHRLFLQEIEDVDFYEHGRGGTEEFVPGSPGFKLAIRKLADGLETLLRRMRRANQRVHVAWPSDECVDVWKELSNELRSKGFDVQPMGPRDSSFAEKLLIQDLERAVLSIHMLGATYDEFTERIALLAADQEAPMLFWLSRAAGATSDTRQKALIESIRSGIRPDDRSREWPRGWSFITDAAVRRFIDVVVTKLRPQAADVSSRPAPLTAQKTARASTVYIVHDATTPEDTRVALDIKEQISRTEKMDVFVSRSDLGSPTELKMWHENLLRWCDGVLLYRNLAPEGWWNQLAPEIMLAERRFDRQPLKSLAFLLPQPPTWKVESDVKVLSYNAPFQLGEIEPFLNPLRAAGSSR